MKIAIIRLSSFGDVIFTAYAISDIRQKYPEATINLYVDPIYYELAKLNSLVTQVVSVEFIGHEKSQKSRIKELWSFARNERRQKYDFVIDTQGMYKSVLVSRILRTKRRIGLPRNRSEGLAFLFGGESKELRSPSQVGPRLQIAWALGIEIDARRLVSGYEYLRHGRQTSSHKTAILAAYGSSPRKYLPESVVNTIIKFLKQRGYEIILIWGSKAEHNCAITLGAKVPGVTIPALALSIGQLANLMASSELFIGTDTGPTHLAMAIGVPAFVLFGPTSANSYFYRKGTSVALEGVDSKYAECKLIESRLAQWLTSV